jgi:hypothetical protein
MQDTQRVGYKYPRGISFRRSVIFSVGFVAGAWWASRARLDDGSRMEVERDDWAHDQVGAMVLGRRPSMAFANGPFQADLHPRADRAK